MNLNMKKLIIIFVVCLGIFGAVIGYVTMKNDGQEPDSFYFVLKGTLPNSAFDGQQFPIKHWKRTIGHIDVKEINLNIMGKLIVPCIVI